jgi:hypothetical protein
VGVDRHAYDLDAKLGQAGGVLCKFDYKWQQTALPRWPSESLIRPVEITPKPVLM